MQADPLPYHHESDARRYRATYLWTVNCGMRDTCGLIPGCIFNDLAKVLPVTAVHRPTDVYFVLAAETCYMAPVPPMDALRGEKPSQEVDTRRGVQTQVHGGAEYCDRIQAWLRHDDSTKRVFTSGEQSALCTIQGEKMVLQDLNDAHRGDMQPYSDSKAWHWFSGVINDLVPFEFRWPGADGESGTDLYSRIFSAYFAVCASPEPAVIVGTELPLRLLASLFATPSTSDTSVTWGMEVVNEVMKRRCSRELEVNTRAEEFVDAWRPVGHTREEPSVLHLSLSCPCDETYAVEVITLPEDVYESSLLSSAEAETTEEEAFRAGLTGPADADGLAPERAAVRRRTDSEDSVE
eukprot:TRINITY_DN58924_c0_g1_i4.p1 TRINITY_DN58924_c0_g1~~TRINITY_DN58924_c0_g1_i4.p1  ORF type:complete len:392 (-),score=47.62 TRINITY_DN58924_c0_g1_i4:891-1943(-)